MDTARRVSDMSPEEFLTQFPAFNNINLAIGRNATPEELKELRRLRLRVRRRLNTALRKATKARDERSLNAQAVLSTMEQFYNEAVDAGVRKHGWRKC
jgi:hypothetical protein